VVPLAVFLLLAVSLFVVFHDGHPAGPGNEATTPDASAEGHPTPHVDLVCALIAIGVSVLVVRPRSARAVRGILPAVPAARRWLEAATARSGPWRSAPYDFCPILA
jgi:hypothetical protein